MMLRWSQRCENGAKNGPKMAPRWLLDAHVGVKMALRWATWWLLGASWWVFWFLGRDLCKKWAITKTLVKHNENGGFLKCWELILAAKSAKIGQHDHQDDHLRINLAASGSIWGAFWSHLCKKAENRKTLKNLRFLLVFQGFRGSPGEQFGSIWTLYWAILVLLAAILASSCSKLGSRRPQDGAWKVYFSMFLGNLLQVPRATHPKLKKWSQNGSKML